MLLKYRHNLSTIIALLLACYGLLVGFGLSAQEAGEKMQVHGFLAQGVIDVNGSNYVNDDENVSLELTEVGINASYQLSEDVRLAGQAVYLNGGNRYADGFHIDYLLLDWSFFTNEHWQANLYLGRIKNYHWLYSSTRDVPMTRPSILLPQSVYFDGTRNMSVGGDGAALTLKHFSDTWGDFDFNISSSYSELDDKQTDIIMGPYSNGNLDHDSDLQASLYWQPELSSWRFGVAMTDAKFEYKQKPRSLYKDGDLKLDRFYVNGEYQSLDWGVSFELLQETMKIDGLLYPSFHRKTTGQGGFLQGEYQLNEQLKLLARAEHYYANKKDKSGRKLEQSTYGFVPKYFGYQHELVVGATYNLAADKQIQIEHHWVKGTARLTPIVLPNPTVNDQEYWQILAVQFVYWF